MASGEDSIAVVKRQQINKKRYLKKGKAYKNKNNFSSTLTCFIDVLLIFKFSHAYIQKQANTDH